MSRLRILVGNGAGASHRLDPLNNQMELVRVRTQKELLDKLANDAAFALVIVYSWLASRVPDQIDSSVLTGNLNLVDEIRRTYGIPVLAVSSASDTDRFTSAGAKYATTFDDPDLNRLVQSLALTGKVSEEE